MNTATIFLAFCVLAVASALGGPITDKMRADFGKCIAETGADREMLKKVSKGGDGDFDDKMKCFAACMQKAHGMMKEDGSVDVELGKSRVPSDLPSRDKVYAAVETCATEKGANECETGHLISLCMNKSLKGIMSDME